jgi:hypothetical protein
LQCYKYYVMISVIISSADAARLQKVTENITATIDAPFEIIAIDNSKGQRGICAVYNEGGRAAKFDILCFMHEDVIIETKGWGRSLNDIFKNDNKIGLVGIAGAAYKSLTPSPWSGYGIDTRHINLIQSYKYKDSDPELLYRNPDNSQLADVACIDGVFMCTSKNVFSAYQFDEDTFKNFHLYDVDLSINIGQQYRVVVTFDILLNHLSEGSYDKVWLQDNLKLHEKWNDHLPINIAGLDLKQQQFIEKLTFKALTRQLKEFGMPAGLAYKVLWQKRFRKLYFALFLKLNYYLLK